ncbi:alanine--tRNA ligase [Zavarzinia compransoris]|uniref:Alanine--tRNA ligase n=1 Tax=Zavarzinia compransoris TaxID=1264899 RepID=A0A317E985_9PROT|nr:alanine--tRNA ligase [Zavarzinia compransoris]PWR21883.1 alanine--tRNA ligase [Zavarzinia compransoris]TDP45311.1 alanyl-tRNA synthetase [Zavarzinia compransoris]
MKSINEIRSTFTDFFVKAGHRHVASSPLVPANDPTLMFTNAGMVQFKDIFTGKEKRDYLRAATAQKCVRAGGKHNDLDNVGYTARHHTFFEMLGNFSFGDYFKETAIELAWTLITRDFGLPKDKLLVTVYHEDEEAAALWKKIAGLPEDRIIRIATSDNFWAMGDTGPCGPCSEIFFDHGPAIWGGPPGSADQDGDRFIEIWNLVFMQFEQSADGTRVALPKPSIDTGMGLERVSAVLQGVHNNYDTDLFQSLIAASADATNTDPKGPMAASHRVIADHLRASSFLIADGVMPSNEGRGNVLRRIMRRAMRHAQLLGARDPLMYRLVPALIKQMGVAYPELIRAEALVTETLKLEETRFKQTLERGLKLLDDEVEKLGSGQPLPGDVAFRLYDTYGFPLDLTQDALRAKDIAVDVDGFNTAMAHQKAEARKAWAGSGEAATDLVWYELKEEVGASEFLGYETEEAEGKLVGLVVDGQRVAAAAPGTRVALVLNQTPFYGESGGQAGDTGVIRGPGYSIAVTDTAKKLGLHIHLGTLEGAEAKVGDNLHLTVDHGRRSRLRANHSATHLLHKALRDVLGAHVTQKGSLVAEERLRFDISHPKALSDEEIEAVENGVNAAIRGNGGVTTRLMTPDEAIKAGALALFGEKYGDEVRVVSMGGADLDHAYSTELCGGTHVFRTGDIAVFKIVAESAVSAGVRRIEALTGAAALKHLRDEEALLKKAAAAVKASPAELPERVAVLLEDRKRLERELAEAKKQLATGGGSGGGLTATEVNGVKVIAKKLDGVNPKDLRGLVDETKKQIGSGIIAFVTVNDGKAALVVGVTEDLVARHSAVDLIRIGVEAVGGKGGGGRPDMAQAGGPDGDKAEAALDAIVKAVAA